MIAVRGENKETAEQKIRTKQIKAEEEEEADQPAVIIVKPGVACMQLSVCLTVRGATHDISRQAAGKRQGNCRYLWCCDCSQLR